MGRWRCEVGYGTHAAMPTRTDAHNITTATDGDMHLVGVAILAGVRAGTRLRSSHASAALFVLLIIVCDLYSPESTQECHRHMIVVVELPTIINFSVGKGTAVHVPVLDCIFGIGVAHNCVHCHDSMMPAQQSNSHLQGRHRW